MKRIRYKMEDLERALTKLNESVKRQLDEDDLVLDATIQRFEYTYELSWKLMKAFLEYNGHQNTSSPRQTIKTGFKEGMVLDGSSWIQMLEDRNRTSHTYDHQIAMDIYVQIKDTYIHLLNDLFTEMTKRLNDL